MRLTLLQLKQAGFDDDSIASLLEQQRPTLKAAGFSDFQINKSLGLRPKSTFAPEEDFTIADQKPIDNSGILASQPETSDVMKATKSKGVKEEIQEEEQDEQEDMQFIANNENLKSIFDIFAPDIKERDRAFLEETALRIEQSLMPLNALDLQREKYGDVLTKKVTGSGQYAPTKQEEIREPKLKIPNPDTTTGPLSMKMLMTVQNPLEDRPATPEELFYMNEFAGIVMAIESDGRNIINNAGYAGYFQYGKPDFKVALNRYKRRSLRYDEDFQTPEWWTKANEHLNPMSLTMDQMKAVFLADFLEKPASQKYNKKGTDFYIPSILKGDAQAAKEAYLVHHHAMYKPDETGQFVLSTDDATLERATKYFDTVFGSSDYGYKDAEQALLTKGGPVNTVIPQKYLNKIGVTLGTSPKTQSIYGIAHDQSLNGFIQKFHDIAFGKNAPEDNITPPEYMRKKYEEVFMHQPMTYGEQTATMALTILEDTPYYLAAGGGCYAAGRAGALALSATGAGAGAGAVLNASLPVVCGGIGMALPDTVRHAYSESLKTGQVGNVREFFNNFTDIKAAKVAAKSFAIGGVTVGTGQLVGKYTDKIIPRLAAETVAMTTVASMLESHIPTLKDFIQSAILIGGVHTVVNAKSAGSTIRNTLMDIYEKYSIHPRDVLKVLEKHPVARDQIIQGRIPKIFSEPAERIHKKLMETKGITIEAAPKYEINEVVNVSVSGERGRVVERTKVGPTYEYKVQKVSSLDREMPKGQAKKDMLKRKTKLKKEIKYFEEQARENQLMRGIKDTYSLELAEKAIKELKEIELTLGGPQGEIVTRVEPQMRKADNSDIQVRIEGNKIYIDSVVEKIDRKKQTNIDDLVQQKTILEEAVIKAKTEKEIMDLDAQITQINKEIDRAERIEKDNYQTKEDAFTSYERTYEKNKSSKDGDNWGIPNDPPPSGATKDGWKDLYNNAMGLDLEDLVELSRILIDKVPELKTPRDPTTRGFFQSIQGLDPKDPRIKIVINEALQSDPRAITQVFAHELGHLLDFVSDSTMARGNILGSLGSFKRFGNQWIDGKGKGAEPLNKTEINKLKKRAEAIAKRAEKQTDAELNALRVGPETVLKIFNDPKARDTIPKEFYEAFVKLSDALKKQVVKDAMKGMTSPYIKAIVDKVNGKKVDPKLSDKANEIFQKLFTREIRKRGLVSKEEITIELKNLSQAWKPFDRNIDPKYTKYRDNPRELFADFMMAFLLRNKWTKNNAPKSYEVFMNYMDKKPEFKSLYEDIQNSFMAGPDARYSRTIMNIEKMQQRSAKKTTDAYLNLPYDKLGNRVMDTIGSQFIDKYFYLIQRWSNDTKRWINDLAKENEYRMQRYLNRWSVTEPYVNQMKNRVLNQLEKFNYTPENLGTMLFLRNLAESKQRESFANPLGVLKKENPSVYQEITKRPVEETLKYYKELHPELYKIADDFYKIRQEYILPELKEGNIIGSDDLAKIMDNRQYITFSVSKYIEKNIKDLESDYYASGSVRKTKGTLDDIINPFLATIEKDLLLVSYARRNRFKAATADFLLNSRGDKLLMFDAKFDPKTKKFIPPKLIEKAKMIGKGKVKKPPAGMELFTFKDLELVVDPKTGRSKAESVVKRYYIDKKIARGFETDVIYNNALFNALGDTGLLFKKFYTEYNVLWWNKALIDDIKTTIILNKDVKLLFSKDPFLPYLIKAIGPSIYSVFGKSKPVKSKLGKKLLRPDIGEMMAKEGILMPLSEGYRGQQAYFNKLVKKGLVKEEDIMLDRVMSKVVKNEKDYRNVLTRTIGNFFNAVGKGGRTYDRLVKVGFVLQKEAQAKKQNIPLDIQDLTIRAANDVGTVNYAKKGSFHKLTNAFLLYFGPYVRGLERVYNHAKRDPKGVLTRWMMISGSGVLISKMALWGIFGKEHQELMLGVNDWDRKNSVPIPFGVTPSGKVVYFKIPFSPEERLFNGIWYRVLSKFDGVASEQFGGYNIEENLGKQNLQTNRDYSIISQIGKEGTPSLNPIFGIMGDVITMINGGNPYDTYRQRGAIPDKIQKAREGRFDPKAWAEYTKYLMNNYITGSYYTFQSDDEKAIMREFEEITGIPIIGKGIQQFFKVGQDPVAKLMKESKKEFRRYKAQDRLDYESAVLKLFGDDRELEPLTEDEIIEVLDRENMEFLNNAFTAKQLVGDSDLQGFVYELLTAQSKEEQMFMLQKVQNHLDNFAE